MKTARKAVAFTATLQFLLFIAVAQKQLPAPKNQIKNAASVSDCMPAIAMADLDVNNVRARILVGGDLWWDLSSAKYEIPKGSGLHSVFAGAIWIGGLDGNGQIKAAAQTYRQAGSNDFWGGPVDTTDLSVSFQRCIEFDRLFVITKKEVKDFVESRGDESFATQSIREWPGNGTGNEARYLAPFTDVDLDGLYDYKKGDYPGYLLSGNYPSYPVQGTDYQMARCNNYLFGDKTIWWVFNDTGNTKTETESDAIGLEIRAQAFAFKAPDEVNDMTFYQYQVINRSPLSFNDVYFCLWIDPDLGKYDDDYVGCDVNRGLGYVYNGDSIDEGPLGYGLIPPALGVDFLKGPVADSGDGIDNDRDGCTDCTFIMNTDGDTIAVPESVLPEHISMSKFKYYEGSPSATGNPATLMHFYYYTRGLWKDGTPMTCGGNGYGGSVPVDFMFAGDTDPLCPNWTEATAGNIPGDRRFLMSSGSFNMFPGEVQYITTGVIWAKADTGNQLTSLQKLLYADDKAQALFNNCFRTVEGPDAPDLVIRELNKEIIISLDNTFHLQTELYRQKDPTIVSVNGVPVPDSLKYFAFEGYQVFQLKDATVMTTDLKNPDKARLVMQCDIRNGIGRIVNHYYDSDLGGTVPVEEVNGRDEGIIHSFRITKDLFAKGANDLVNHKTYYYMAVAYAYNNYAPFNPLYPDSLQGQKTPYKAGLHNVKIYSAIPHPVQPEAGGLVLNSAYGSGPSITRMEGQGNGGQILDLTEETIEEILAYSVSYRPVYKPGRGPVSVKVIDPVSVINGSFELRFSGVNDSSRWSIREIIGNRVIHSDFPVSIPNEQILKYEQIHWGLSLKANQVVEAGKAGAVNNAFLEATIQYSDNTQRWLTGVGDVDGISPQNWIRSGTQTLTPTNPQSDYIGEDDQEVYENVLEGTWAPFKLAAIANSAEYYFPRSGLLPSTSQLIQLSPTQLSKTGIASVDMVFTKDKSKWSRAAVIELGADVNRTAGNARQFDLRKSPSVDKDGNPGGDLSVLPYGMGWFPGYAINVETGERLNIAFGENSMMAHQNGADMMWNPTPSLFKNNNELDSVYFGGMHYIYIFGHHGDNVAGKTDVPAYDQCRFIATMLDSASATNNNNIRRNVWKDCQWVSLPLTVQGKQLLSSDVKIRIRIARAYRPLAGTPVINNSVPLSAGTTYYVCNPPVTFNGITYNSTGDSFTASVTAPFTGSGLVTASAPSNSFMPYYVFNTANLVPLRNDISTAQSALDLIQVVPNPYYAFSAYERRGEDRNFEAMVKITNLPAVCRVTILNLSGKVIRRFDRKADSDNSYGTVTGTENTTTSINWDLKNEKGIQAGSGLYLIHVYAPGLGERTLKWFGVMRETSSSFYE